MNGRRWRLWRTHGLLATCARGISVVLASLGLLALTMIRSSSPVEAASTTSTITQSGFTCGGQSCPVLTLSVGDSVVYVNETGTPLTVSIVSGTPTSTPVPPQGTLTYTAEAPTSDAQVTAHSVTPPLLFAQSLVVNPVSTPAPSPTPTPPALSSSSTSSTSTPSSTPAGGSVSVTASGSGGQVPGHQSGAPAGTPPSGGAVAIAPSQGSDLSCTPPTCPAGGGSSGSLSAWWILLPFLLAATIVGLVYVWSWRTTEPTELAREN
jgi:hypothetical protein